MKNLTFILCLMLLVGCNDSEEPKVIPAEEVSVEETTD